MTQVGPVGKLERVPLRNVWSHEAYGFTRWLQDNVEALNEALNVTLVNVEREQAAGSFSIDLVAEDEGGGKVIIENQGPSAVRRGEPARLD
jgi:RecB family endonuclease NucS